MKLLQQSSQKRKSARPEMPHLVAPMLATLSANLPPRQSDFAFEYKWDGVRAILRWDGTELSIQSRNQLDITARYPEIWPISGVFGSRDVLLDGEIIALDEEERPSFSRLQRRMHVNNRMAVKKLMGEVPVYFVVFDVLWLDGESLFDLPWIERRDRLEELELDGGAWMRSPATIGEGTELFAAAREMHLEGIVAKKTDSLYRPDVRSPDWLKIKNISDDEFVIGGWIGEGGTRSDRVGSLLVGQYDEQGNLIFMGGVGTGFNNDTHDRLTQLLHSLASDENPFATPVPKRGAHYVKPKLVAQIEFRRKGPGGILQQAAFKGLRSDKSPKEVGRQ